MQFKDLLGRFVPVFAIGAVLVSGCTTTTSGEPSPGEAPPTTDAAPSSTRNRGGGGASAAIDPCTLVLIGDLSSYGTFKGPTKDVVGDSRGCNYVQTGGDSEPKFGLSVAIRDRDGISLVSDRGFGKTDGDLNGRKTAKVPTSARNCMFVLAIGEGSRVDVVISSQESARSCQVAEQLGDVVEPRLPK
ncbi:DUF3558 domain-containing protein [Allokutzneria sp. NRRL B-24872]|uniref:DUF3558 domain-containing protein n=1 Tax=Allokutzneria sp. NRRL B-24872 TaxID=1137961 RepID=UPI000A3D3446|nr:DUF3558 domain-containing protein [Allokutzneria sp. NRRL B-24872]